MREFASSMDMDQRQNLDQQIREFSSGMDNSWFNNLGKDYNSNYKKNNHKDYNRGKGYKPHGNHYKHSPFTGEIEISPENRDKLKELYGQIRENN